MHSDVNKCGVPDQFRLLNLALSSLEEEREICFVDLITQGVARRLGFPWAIFFRAFSSCRWNLKQLNVTIDSRLHLIVGAQPYPLLFATISGAHLYGFPSPDSDFDLRGVHVLPLEKVVGLDVRDETVQDSRVIEKLEMDIVSREVRKFFGLLLKKNGHVLEQLFLPLIIHTTPEREEWKAICAFKSGEDDIPFPEPGGFIAGDVITKHHAHQYSGFAETQWNLLLKESPRRVKPLLYVYRVLLTGIHLTRTGVIESTS